MRIRPAICLVLFLAPSCAEAPLDSAIANASARLAAGEVEDALQLLQPVAVTAEAQFQVARLLLENSLPWQAVDFSSKARQAMPRRADVAFVHGSILVSIGRYADAAETLEPLLAIPNAPPKVAILLAQAHLGAARPGDAVNVLNATRERFPRDPQLAVQLAFAYLRSAQPGPAKSVLREARAVEPSIELATVALRDGDADSASLVLDAIEPFAVPEQLVLLRAHLLDLQEKQDEAIALVRSHPNVADTAPGALVVGIAHYHSGRYKEASKSFRAALAKSPRLAVGEHYLGLALASLGKYEDSEQCHRRAVAADPRNAAYRFQLGWILARLNRINEARGFLRQAVALNPRHAPSLNELGRLALDERDPEEAMDLLKKAIHADPQFDQPYLLLSTACRQLKRPAEAKKWLTQFQELKQKDRDHRTSASQRAREREM